MAFKRLAKQGELKEHHLPLTNGEVLALVTRLRLSSQSDMGRLSFEFLIFTAARTGEGLKAEWLEVDEGQLLWTVPATRVKARRGNHISLTGRAMVIPQLAWEVNEQRTLFFTADRVMCSYRV